MSSTPTAFVATKHTSLLLPHRSVVPGCIHSAQLFTKTKSSELPKHHPDKGDLIYVGKLTTMVRYIKAFSVSTSVIGIGVQPVIFNATNELPTILKIAMGGFMSFFIFLSPLLLHLIAKRYVTSMYYNRSTGKFTLSTYTFFVYLKDTVFTTADVEVLNVPAMFTNLRVKDVPLLVDPSSFIDREAYIRLMSYDKPMDWELPPDDRISRGNSNKDGSVKQ